MRAIIPPLTSNRVQSRLKGGLDDTLVVSLFREAQPLPETVEPERVRALHSSQLLDLIRSVIRDHDTGWTQRMERLSAQLDQLQAQKETAAAQHDSTRRYELPRMAALIDAERSRAEGLERERDDLADRVALLEGAAEARRDRLVRLETAVLGLEDALTRDTDAEAQAAEARAQLDERTATAHRLLAERDHQIAAMRRAGAQLKAALAVSRKQARAGVEEAEALREERELVNAALAAADDVLAKLSGHCSSARAVQHLSKRLGTLSSPKGAEHLRGVRTDFPLFGELQKAQAALSEGYAQVGDSARELEGIRKAVGDRLQASAWLKQELRQTRQALRDTRALCKQLERERRVSEDEQSEQARRIVDLEDRIAALSLDANSTRHENELTKRELQAAQEKLQRSSLRVADLRKTETFKRSQIQADAIKALEAADADRERLARERDALANELRQAKQAGKTSRLKVERLMRALHRDQASA